MKIAEVWLDWPCIRKFLSVFNLMWLVLFSCMLYVIHFYFCQIEQTHIQSYLYLNIYMCYIFDFKKRHRKMTKLDFCPELYKQVFDLNCTNMSSMKERNHLLDCTWYHMNFSNKTVESSFSKWLFITVD